MKETTLRRAAVAAALLLPAAAALTQPASNATPPPAEARTPAAAAHAAVGVVKRVDRRSGTVTLAHEPVKSLGWPAMTMGFKVTDPSLFDKLIEGRKVEFTFTAHDRNYVLKSVK